ncbi:MAG: UvrD-helicase domain-containing protein [Bdellovibrionota bacterium]
MVNNLATAKLIEANAGSGKTFSLTLEYIKLLLEGESVENILATTFTKKAASEILSRVIERLAMAVLDKEEEKELLLQINSENIKLSPKVALNNLIKFQHKIMISTMDSFFAKIATIFSTELGFISKIDISSEDVKNGILAEAMIKLFKEEEPKKIYDFLNDISNKNEIKSVSDSLFEHFNSFYSEFKNTTKEAWGSLSYDKELLSKDYIASLINDISNTKVPKNKNGSEKANYLKVKTQLLSDLENGNFDNLLTSQLFQNIINGVSTFDRIEIPIDIKFIAQKVIKLFCAYNIEKLNNKTNLIYGLIKKFSKIYEETRDKIGALDFSELKWTLSKIASLDNLNEIYYRLDTRLRHILLDEFQDTSREEWVIIKPMVDEILSSIERTFFCVGDPKQAIYAWRGGVADIFKTIKDNWPQVKKEVLAKSYRSSPVIIDFVNLICKNFKSIDVEECFKDVIEKWDENFSEHLAHNKELRGNVLVQIISKEKEEENKEDTNENVKEDKEDREDNIHVISTCKRVKELVDKYPQISIGVLCRSNNLVGEIIFALNEPPYNIKASQEGKVRLVDFKSVIFILSVLKYMEHRRDTMCLFKIKSVSKELFGDEVRDKTLQLLKRIFIDDGFKGVVSFLYKDIKDKLSSLEKLVVEQLIDICILYDQEGKKNIDEFLNYVSLQTMVNITSSNVRVMTMHAAKGLEFDAVVLPNIEDDIFKHQDKILHYYEDRTKKPKRVLLGAKASVSRVLEKEHEVYSEMALQEKKIKLEETFCLLYVALTRAKQSLSIFISKDYKNKLTKKNYYSMASFILQILGSKISNEEVFKIGDDDFYKVKEEKKSEAKKCKDKNKDKNKDKEILFTSFKKKEKEKNLSVKSPSNEEGDGEYLVKDILNINLEQTLKRGSVYHKFFENISWLDEVDVEAKNFIIRDAQNDFSESELSEMFEKFKNSLTFPKIRERLSKAYYFDTWEIDDIEVLVEEPIMFKQNDVIYKGFIDRVVLGYKKGKISNIEIIDFKTDSVSSENVGSKLSFYKPQIEIYKNALVKQYGEVANVDTVLMFVMAGKVYKL